MHRKRRRPTGLPAGTRSVVGWIDLVRAGRRPYRSSVERDGLIRLDLDHGVASMERNDLSELRRLADATRPDARVPRTGLLLS